MLNHNIPPTHYVWEKHQFKIRFYSSKYSEKRNNDFAISYIVRSVQLLTVYVRAGAVDLDEKAERCALLIIATILLQ